MANKLKTAVSRREISMMKFAISCIAAAVFVTSPAWSVDLDRPEQLGAHYLCSRITQKDPSIPSRRVTMEDQFGQVRARLLRPKYVCSPTSKSYVTDKGKQRDEPRNETTLHFVCYEFEPKIQFKRAEIANQFTNYERQEVRVNNREMLCVPSFKWLPSEK